MAVSPANSHISAGITRAQAEAVQMAVWPDVWATKLELQVDAHAFTAKGREFEVGILRDESENIIVPKGAQLGLTTTFLIKCVHAIIERKLAVLYLLPIKAGSVQFVQGRIDPMLDSNATLAKQFSRTDNRVQKVTAAGVKWYIRGTNIASELREAPADILVLDERDVANEDNLDDARERIGGSPWQRTYELSTPTVDGHGVYADDAYPASDQHQWWVRCPSCSSYQVLTFEQNLLPWIGESAEETRCCCSHCSREFSDMDRAAMNTTGKWVPLEPNSNLRGYHVNQLNSPTKRLAVMMKNWFAGQRDSRKLKSFYTLGLGLPYTSPGDKFTIELLNKCRGAYEPGGLHMSTLYIGIDVGHDVLHVTYWVVRSGKRVLWDVEIVERDATRTKWQVLEEDILRTHHNWVAVCDAHPDKEDCEALSKKFPGRFWMGFEKDRPDQPSTADFQAATADRPAKVNIDRTMAFDSLIKSYIDGHTVLPRNAHELGEYMPGLGYNGFYYQHFNMVRVEQADASDRLVARWVNTKSGLGATTATANKTVGSSGKKADHWQHSDMFGLMATMASAPLVVPSDVGELLVAAGGLIRG